LGESSANLRKGERLNGFFVPALFFFSGTGNFGARVSWPFLSGVGGDGGLGRGRSFGDGFGRGREEERTTEKGTEKETEKKSGGND
jgi:hypothetical protein